MVAAVRVHKPGGPEALVYEDVQVGAPGPGQIRIKQHACGINFIDVYQRTGLYQNPLPLTLGMEAAGVIEAVRECYQAWKYNLPGRAPNPAVVETFDRRKTTGQIADLLNSFAIQRRDY